MFWKVKIQGKDEGSILMNLEKTNSVGWAALTVTFLPLTSWEEKTHDGEASACLLPPQREWQYHLPAPGSWERAWCGFCPSIKGKKSEKWERKLLIPTVVTWGHAVRSYKGIKAALFRWFLSGKLISWYLMQAVRRTVGLDITYSMSHKPGAPTEH